MAIKRTLILRIRLKQLKLLWFILRNEGFENVTSINLKESGNQWAIYIMCSYECMLGRRWVEAQIYMLLGIWSCGKSLSLMSWIVTTLRNRSWRRHSRASPTGTFFGFYERERNRLLQNLNFACRNQFRRWYPLPYHHVHTCFFAREIFRTAIMRKHIKGTST